MIFKVYYQPSKKVNPKRENTEVLYLDTDSEVNARLLVESNTEYNVEFIEGLDEATLAYEKESPNFKLTEF
ncbi:DNA-dependent RNA polymerase auxiliary subunit epsilon family protein [Ligilactobacillus agilis]|uniref:DNA-directed RNA polymerase subunit epsilon n=1 Tax=Ligilactobacillus agilis TaxID=1601 RepID=UPI00067F4033|nr:DNA-directed RNA polymerase subunit epsilon [Ligilactobacillus agilis]UNL42878.1 DNA-dependent RNA polymerase auxiliary subunit epsilon family protein [Ligilactobacillus agilis]UNL58017.1 DNA-dependent RNA polymerase auxiliary subunit epsilon family protein [Ligilactobacillus agilis]